MSHQREKQPLSTRQLTLRLVAATAALVFILTIFYILGRQLENQGREETRGDLSARYTPALTFTWQGDIYQKRNEITTVLFIGVDQGENESDNRRARSGQADFLLLLVIDDEAKTVTPVQIDRDTMTEIAVVNVLGKLSGTRVAQICLSHGFGTDNIQACELTVSAVSKLLLGSEIDYYAAINLNGISALNDAAGGVTVTLEDDFSAFDPMMLPGVTLTLHGKQAEYYVRSRYGIGDSSNKARMARQRDYLSKYSALLDSRLHENTNFIGALFDAIEPYMTTNIKRGRIIGEALNARNYIQRETIRPEGAYSRGEDGYIEFHADETSIKTLVMNLFFKIV